LWQIVIRKKQQDSLASAKITIQDKLLSCQKIFGIVQEILGESAEAVQEYLEHKSACQSFLQLLHTSDYNLRSKIILEQERLSYAVVDLVLEWKRSKVKD